MPDPRLPAGVTRRTALATGALACAGFAHANADTAPDTTTDWPTATPQSEGLREDALTAALQAGESTGGLRAVAVARHGKLVAERYYGGAAADTLQPVNSATKSVCSMLVGLALRDGRLKSLDETLAQLLPEALAEVPGSPVGPVTLRQLLSGRSGLDFDWRQFDRLLRARPLLRFVLELPAGTVPPPGWSYNDALVALLSHVLERAQGADLAALAQRQLFGPLGIERFSWRRDAEGRPLAPGGLVLRPRDLLKLATVMADGGRWQGRAVLPEDWVAESLAPKGPATWRAGPLADVGYGYLWFTGQLHGQRVAWAWGYGGQFALLAPALGLTVATAATSPPPAALGAQTNAVMTLVGGVVQAALPG